MATTGTRLVERVKDEALRLGTKGVWWVVEGTATALRTLDRLREWLPREEREAPRRTGQGNSVMEHQRREPALYRPPPERARPAAKKQVSPEVQATAERVLEEARAAKERIKKAQPAPKPLIVSADVEEQLPHPAKRGATRKTARTQGRKTMASATAPKRAKAPEQGFKAKRGQKHKH